MNEDHLLPETIGAFIDDELAPFDRAHLQEHLSVCHMCALKVISAGMLKRATGRAAQAYAPSAATLARLTAAASEETPRRARVIPIRTTMWASIAAMFLIAVVIGGGGVLRRSESLSAELLDQHLATLSDSSSPQVISTDRHTVKPWFEGKLPFSFNIPEPNSLPADTVLTGANLTYMKGKPAALLLFTIHKHHASVFLCQSGIFHDLLPGNNRAGFHISTKQAGGLELIGVSDTNSSELDALVAKIAAVQ